ncbi:DsbA family protein [Nonomuraea soli]|uniref:Protein-disulfide isomerase n=1 Tax=Nonomuraea soli TaxID=1032476 RepID=A0A7W0HNG4_9ACTN|nr:thioredoxin domain-containing protein [Nonomuraea soli]MBA2889779.1 protein-disulfide isomerase [Nonomuraea soli]
MGKADREKSARDRIKQQQAEERAREKRKKIVTYVTAGVVALAAVGAGYWFNASRTQTEEAAAAALAPITVAADGSIVMAKQGVEKPVLDVYEDFQCPACREFESVSGQTFKNLAYEGKAKVVYHPLTIFSMEPTKGNSERAGAAAMCIPGGSQWMAFHDKLFEEQPPETVEGFKVDDMVGWGEEVGVTTPGFADCVRNQSKLAAHTAFSNAQLESAKIQGTPTIKLNGTQLEGNQLTPDGLRQAVQDAAK